MIRTNRLLLMMSVGVLPYKWSKCRFGSEALHLIMSIPYMPGVISQSEFYYTGMIRYGTRQEVLEALQ